MRLRGTDGAISVGPRPDMQFAHFEVDIIPTQARSSLARKPVPIATINSTHSCPDAAFIDDAPDFIRSRNVADREVLRAYSGDHRMRTRLARSLEEIFKVRNDLADDQV
jgi:hypothetical protein